MLARDEILEAESKCGSLCKKRKNLKTEASKELEKILEKWFQQMRADNISIDGPVLHEKAIDIALWLNTDNFKASNRWLH
jgi:hypothetical protein